MKFWLLIEHILFFNVNHLKLICLSQNMDTAKSKNADFFSFHKSFAHDIWENAYGLLRNFPQIIITWAFCKWSIKIIYSTKLFNYDDVYSLKKNVKILFFILEK